MKTHNTRVAAAVAATAAFVWLMVIVFPRAWPAGLVLQGALFGAGSGLLALGLVLTYRTLRVINLAYQAMGACAAEAGVVLYQHYGVPWLPCIVIAIAAGGLVGAATDLLMRRFRRSSRLVVTVATIGLLQIYTAFQALLPYAVGAPLLTVQFHTGLSNASHRIGTTPFFGDDLLALALVPLALAALSWFLYRTDAGVAVRGIAENDDRARLLGIPARRLILLVWVGSGALAAAVAILFAPRNGIPASPFVAGGGMFLPALAAAVVARMESLPTAFFVAVGLGTLDSVTKVNSSKQSVGTVVFVAVILIALLAQRDRSTRASTAGDDSALSTNGRALPAPIAALREVRIARAALVAAIAGLAALVPLVVAPSTTHTYSGYLLLGMVALSLVLLSGWSGNVSVGQFSIAGVGAVVAGDLIVKANVDLFAALLAGALAGALIGVVIGLPALRLKPIFLVVTTLAFASAMDQYVLNPTNYPGWIPSRILRPVLWHRYALSSERASYYLCLGFLVLTILAVRSLRVRRPGRVQLAARDNPSASAAVGLSVTRVRVTAMALAGAVAGIAGALWATLQNGVGASSFPVQTSVLVFSMAVVGGLGSISGALCGVVATEGLVATVNWLFPNASRATSLATGTLLLLVLLLFPGGIAEAIERIRDALAARIARRHGLAMEVGAAAGSVGYLAPAVEADVVPIRRPIRPVPTDPPLLSCHGVEAAYGPLQVLFGVDIDIAAGEMVALLGTNGAGKSTVFKAIAGLLPVGRGDVQLGSRSLAKLETDEIARLGIAMMPGGRGVFPTLTVADNLRLAGWQLRSDPADARQARADMTALFPILEERAHQLAGNLSGGEQQQLSMAMALMARPNILLSDELSLGLAPTVVSMLCDKVRRIHAAGTTVVVVEQSVNVALTLADRAVFLEKGQVRFEGRTADLLDRPDILRSVFVGETGADLDGEAPSRTAPSHDTRTEEPGPALVCTGLVKSFGGIHAVDHVDLSIPPGRIVGLVGHNGAGKTTLFDVISGFHRPEAGTISLGGVDITDAPTHWRALGGLGRSFQEARLFPALTVRENIVVALDRHLACHDTLSAVMAMPAALDAEAAAARRADELMELLGLGGFAATPTGDLSTGTRRLVELACQLAFDPAVLLLDEPTAGVAQSETEALGPLLRRVQQEAGCSIVVIEHDMAMLRDLCDELVALELGAVICQGTPAEVLAHPRVIESYLGVDETAVNRSGPRARALVTPGG